MRFSLLVAVALAGSSIAAPGPERWQKDINTFKAADAKNPPPAGGVLFVGSSSIRLWDSLQDDFPNQPVIQRGFGGSEIADSTWYAGEIVLPYRPRAIVLYAGDNDIANGKSPEQVVADFKAFVDAVRAGLPDAKVGFIAIKPSVKRLKFLGLIREANLGIREFCESERNLTYIDVFTPMLRPDGAPRNELLGPDELHLNADGYRLWAALVRTWLDE